MLSLLVIYSVVQFRSAYPVSKITFAILKREEHRTLYEEESREKLDFCRKKSPMQLLKKNQFFSIWRAGWGNDEQNKGIFEQTTLLLFRTLI